MRLLIEIGEPEIKHWPCPFAEIAPKVRAWFQDETTRAKIELPHVQKLELPYALGPSWAPGIYCVVFDGGEYMAMEEDVEFVGPVVIEGRMVTRRPALLEALA